MYELTDLAALIRWRRKASAGSQQVSVSERLSAMLSAVHAGPNHIAICGVEDISKRRITVTEESWKALPKKVIDL
jgi:hypothetical protein